MLTLTLIPAVCALCILIILFHPWRGRKGKTNTTTFFRADRSSPKGDSI